MSEHTIGLEFLCSHGHDDRAYIEFGTSAILLNRDLIISYRTTNVGHLRAGQYLDSWMLLHCSNSLLQELHGAVIARIKQIKLPHQASQLGFLFHKLNSKAPPGHSRSGGEPCYSSSDHQGSRLHACRDLVCWFQQPRLCHTHPYQIKRFLICPRSIISMHQGALFPDVHHLKEGTVQTSLFQSRLE